MKYFFTLALLCILSNSSRAQDTASIAKSCRLYIEGFYEGDTAKLISCLQPTLYKIGYWKDQKSDEYAFDGQMTYSQAIAYAKKVKASGHFAKPDAPKKVIVLESGNHIAAAKVTAWWGIDYLLLSKQGDRWMIEQVLWEGPLLK